MNKRPNFIVFVTDQQPAGLLGCEGHRLARTPALDALAAQGCLFDAFHVATPLCQPNRASLMTSRLPSLHGVQMNGRELSHGERTFVELLRAAGWRTALVGKAHLQNITTTPPAWPAPDEPRRALAARRQAPGVHGQELWQRWEDDPGHELERPYYGFDEVALTIGHADEQHGHWRRWLRAQAPDAERLIGPAAALPAPGFELTAHRQAWRTALPEELHPTRWVAERCCDLLERWAGERARAGSDAAQAPPFFLQCSFPDPHHPYTPPGRWWDLVSPDDVPLPASFHAPLHDPPAAVRALREAAAQGAARKSGHGVFACTEREAREAIALNLGSLGFIDDAVARVHATLRRLGLDDDTVIAFTSDHGDMLGDRGLMLKGGLHYRALTRVPFFWRDTKDRRRPGRSAALAQTLDIGATVLERAGVEPAHGMQGVSLLGLTEGRAPAVRQHLLIEEEGQRRDFGWNQRVRMRTLLTPRHRLTLWAGQDAGELVDLLDDPLELRNLWADPACQGVRAQLTEALARAMIEAAETSPYPERAA
jgi:arylsulfatase A-like enzyme